MDRMDVAFDEYFSELCQALQGGGCLLVSVDQNERPNVMTIGWAQTGIIWGRPICTVLVRPSRYTYGCCNATGDFTLNVPYKTMADDVMFCGTESGRDYDKFEECDLTAMPAASDEITSPYIAECGLAYECKTVHHNDMIPDNAAQSVARQFYGQGDWHRLFFGHILATHAHTDFPERFPG